jgi:7,8-dihydropterin-6-yl-methyl-4-(beta-D-ribofuranosyl)aminobenzene 5'-phosphate synthase
MLSEVKITCLVADQAGPGLVAEHGFALWIETADQRILFDTGQGGALFANAGKLGIDLSTTTILILSHGHYDHTGGVAGVLQLATGAVVYYHLDALRLRFSIHEGIAKPVGMDPATARTIRNLPATKHKWVHKPLRINPDIGITGPIPRKYKHEDTGGPFFLDEQGAHPDPLIDDMALWLNTAHGVIVCTGCCHAGLNNTLSYINRLSKKQHLHAIAGGFHLLNANAKRIEKTITLLQLAAPEHILPSHCTGEKAIQTLQESFPNQTQSMHSGMSMQFA